MTVDGEEKTVIARESWDVLFAVLSMHGKYLVIGFNIDGRTEIRLFQDGRSIDVPGVAGRNGNVSSVSFSSDWMFPIDRRVL